MYPGKGTAAGKGNGIMESKRSRKKNRKENVWFIRPGRLLYRKMPEFLRAMLVAKVRKTMKGQRLESESELAVRTSRFLEEELSILCWGLTLAALLAAVLFVRAYYMEKAIVLSRNPFGKGQKEQELILDGEGGKESVSIMIEEQELSAEDMNTLFSRFFKDLEQNLCGENPSLSHVSLPLCFDDQLENYPFQISYQPDQLALIGLDGQLGEEALSLKKQEIRETEIEVTAVYRGRERRKKYHVAVTAPSHRENSSVYDKAADRLSYIELSSRDKTEVILPVEIGRIRVKLPGKYSLEYGLLVLFVMTPVCLVFRKYYIVKEKAAKRKKEAAEDFPVIVHLLTLYMRAGLSFSSAVHRISGNYQISMDANRRRHAYDEILWMDQQMRLGVSQKEACAEWGKRNQDNMYRKLSSALIQLLTKGSREADRILDSLEKDAFDQRIDRAREEGKKTETRLLFPMIVLLSLVMVIVLFPAVIRFQGF